MLHLEFHPYRVLILKSLIKPVWVYPLKDSLHFVHIHPRKASFKPFDRRLIQAYIYPSKTRFSIEAFLGNTVFLRPLAIACSTLMVLTVACSTPMGDAVIRAFDLVWYVVVLNDFSDKYQMCIFWDFHVKLY